MAKFAEIPFSWGLLSPVGACWKDNIPWRLRGRNLASLLGRYIRTKTKIKRKKEKWKGPVSNLRVSLPSVSCECELECESSSNMQFAVSIKQPENNRASHKRVSQAIRQIKKRRRSTKPATICWGQCGVRWTMVANFAEGTNWSGALCFDCHICRPSFFFRGL